MNEAYVYSGEVVHQESASSVKVKKGFEKFVSLG